MEGYVTHGYGVVNDERHGVAGGVGQIVAVIVDGDAVALSGVVVGEGGMAVAVVGGEAEGITCDG